ncbi:MAG: hypothetical protein QME63_01305 [Actinomycetota bacterium]|nr:hypothetical protein [Actinomycetota bacterium]
MQEIRFSTHFGIGTTDAEMKGAAMKKVSIIIVFLALTMTILPGTAYADNDGSNVSIGVEWLANIMALVALLNNMATLIPRRMR